MVVDGNAAAGILSEMFAGGRRRSLVGVCGGCGSVAPLAEAVVELDEMAAIIRCRGCTHTLVTVLRTPDRDTARHRIAARARDGGN